MKTITRKLKEDYDFEQSSITIKGEEIYGYISDMRVPAAEIPEGFTKYEIRHADDDDSIMATIEKRVVVNFAYTFITEKNDILDGNEYVEIDDWDFSYDFEDGKSIILDTKHGKVMVVEWCDGETQKSGSYCYTGDNLDELIGELEIPFYEVTEEDIEELFPLNC